MKKKIDIDYIMNRVGKALDTQFEAYSWEHMIDDCELTPAETYWAKKNLSYRVYRIDDQPREAVQ